MSDSAADASGHDTVILGIDTAGSHCAAALLVGAVETARCDAMSRGQAEQLVPMVDNLLAEAGLAWSSISAIGVGIGPGNFTGIRIAVSAARGAALGLGVPAFGVSMFEVTALGAPAGPCLVTLPAPRDRAYAQLFRDGSADGPAILIEPGAPEVDLPDGTSIIGHRAAEIGRVLRVPANPIAQADVPNPALPIARVARHRLAQGGPPPARPAALYVRSADAAPPADPPPVILDA